MTRYRLFDVSFDGGRDRLIGQEEVQNRVYRAISNFVREGGINKLILLHGPNGSAKSTFVNALLEILPDPLLVGTGSIRIIAKRRAGTTIDIRAVRSVEATHAR